MKKVVYWLPRVFGIFAILMLIMFNLEFIETELIIVTIFNLLPVFALIITLSLAWKDELIGGIAFIIVSIAFSIYFKTYYSLSDFLIVSLPVLITGVLFLISYYKNNIRI